MSERQGSCPQSVEHPEDGQAGADGVARLHGDEAADFPGLVGLLKFWKG